MSRRQADQSLSLSSSGSRKSRILRMLEEHVSHGRVDAVSSILQAHLSSGTVQQHGLEGLAVLATKLPNQVARHATLVVFLSMANYEPPTTISQLDPNQNTHGRDAQIQELGCRVLKNMAFHDARIVLADASSASANTNHNNSSNSPPGDEHSGSAAVDNVLWAMQHHPQNPHVQREGCWVLATLLASQEKHMSVLPYSSTTNNNSSMHHHHLNNTMTIASFLLKALQWRKKSSLQLQLGSTVSNSPSSLALTVYHLLKSEWWKAMGVYAEATNSIEAAVQAASLSTTTTAALSAATTSSNNNNSVRSLGGVYRSSSTSNAAAAATTSTVELAKWIGDLGKLLYAQDKLEAARAFFVQCHKLLVQHEQQQQQREDSSNNNNNNSNSNSNRNPLFWAACFAVGELSLEFGDARTAHDMADTILQKFLPSSKRCLVLKAKAFGLQGYWEDAIHMFDLALESMIVSMENNHHHHNNNNHPYYYSLTSTSTTTTMEQDFQAVYEGRLQACLQLHRQHKWQTTYPEKVEHSMEYYTKLADLTIQQKVQPSLRLASICTTLGDALYQKGLYQESLGYLDRAEHMYRELAPLDLARALTLTTLGSILDDVGRVSEALEHYSEAMEIVEEHQQHYNNNDNDDDDNHHHHHHAASLTLTHCLNNVGMIQQRAGKNEEALECFQRALPVVQLQAPFSLSLASNLNNIGYSLLQLNRLEQATNVLQQAIHILQAKAPTSAAMATCLQNLRQVRTKLQEQKHLVMEPEEEEENEEKAQEEEEEEEDDDDDAAKEHEAQTTDSPEAVESSSMVVAGGLAGKSRDDNNDDGREEKPLEAAPVPKKETLATQATKPPSSPSPRALKDTTTTLAVSRALSPRLSLLSSSSSAAASPSPFERQSSLREMTTGSSNSSFLLSAHSLDEFYESYEIASEESDDVVESEFGEMVVAKHRLSGRSYSVSRVAQARMKWNGRDALDDQIGNLETLRSHSGVVRLFEIYMGPERTYLVLEQLSEAEHLLDHLANQKPCTELLVRDACEALLHVVDHMHDKQIVHRNLKPTNIVIPRRQPITKLKVTGFEFSRRMDGFNPLRTICGEPGYVAPELLEHWPAYDAKCDLWSVGVIAYEMLAGCAPFDGDWKEIFEATRAGRYAFPTNDFQGISMSSKQMVTTLLTVEPRMRASARAALRSEWINRSAEDLERNTIPSDKLRQLAASINAFKVVRCFEEINAEFDSYLEDRQDQYFMGLKPKTPLEDHVDENETYDIQDLLVSGDYADVYEAFSKSTDTMYQVKKIHRSKLEAIDATNGIKALEEEVAALTTLQAAPHLVRLHNLYQEGGDCTCLVLEDVTGGDLLQYIAEREVYTETDAAGIFRSVLGAVVYMHKLGIVHRDIRPENVLFDENKSVKLANLALAKRVTGEKSLKTICGTPEFVAPEVLRGWGYDERADYWSCGVLLYLVLSGKTPFRDTKDVLHGVLEMRREYWAHVTVIAKDLVKDLVCIDPRNRINGTAALRSPWLTTEPEHLSVFDLHLAKLKIIKHLPKEKLERHERAPVPGNKFTSLESAVPAEALGAAQAAIAFSQAVAGIRPPSASKEQQQEDKDFVHVYDDAVPDDESLNNKRIGRVVGGFALNLVVHKESKQRYLSKTFSLRTGTAMEAVALQEEIWILKNELKDCPYVLGLQDVLPHNNNRTTTTTTTVLVYKEFVDLSQSLQYRVETNGAFRPDQAADVFRELLQAVDYCHQRRIAIRGVAAESVVLKDASWRVVLVDMSNAKKVLVKNSLRTQCGRLLYTAPEILCRAPRYDVSCDMWSCGVVLFWLLNATLPFEGSETAASIRYGVYKQPQQQQQQQSGSKQLQKLVAKLLHRNPSERITAKSALQDSSLQQDKE